VFGISLFLTLLILSPSFVIIRNSVGIPLMEANTPIISIAIITLQFIFLFAVNSRYKNRGESLNLKWSGEKEPKKSIHGVFVAIALLFPFIIIIFDIIYR
jgi:hypothetical protein